MSVMRVKVTSTPCSPPPARLRDRLPRRGTRPPPAARSSALARRVGRRAGDARACAGCYRPALRVCAGSVPQSQLGDMPVSKQQLRGPSGFLKDTLSLAFYNIGPGATLELTTRSRGGRR